MEPKQPLKVLIFPWLAHGHIFPFFELAKWLSKTNQFRTYFLSTSINLDSVKKNLNANDDEVSIELVELLLPFLPNLPPQYHTTKTVPPHLIPTLLQAFQMSSSSFTNIITNLKPDLLIYDGFQPWAAKIAFSHGIPCIHFATSSATSFSFFHHLHTHKSFDSFPYPSIYLHDYEKKNLLRQAESIKVKDTSDDNFLSEILQLSTEMILIKTCRGLEGKYIDYFSNLSGKKILPVGPLLTRGNEENINSEVMKWLGRMKNESSVLYISFGSENYLSNDQMEEIAKGLELSKVNFIWVVRFPVGSNITINEALPKGFTENTKNRGIVFNEWAAQAQILSNPCVGGFMSHCGWSSVTESIYFGVPIIALPLKLDQPLNSRFVVEAGVGVEISRDANVWFDGKDVANAIDMVILEESGKQLRERAIKLGERMKIEEEQALDEVVEQLSRICMNSKT